ncbi:MAG: hypothetical protein OXF06_00500 [Bacteroidetes bacterium]|nr:hypothetical protein [Bacteroidota bacterium]
MKGFWRAYGLTVILFTIALGLTVESVVGQITDIEQGSLESDWTTLKKLYRMTDGASWINNNNWDVISEQIPNAVSL